MAKRHCEVETEEQGVQSFALAKIFAVRDVRNGGHVGRAAAFKMARLLCDASRAARQAPTEIPPALPCKGDLPRYFGPSIT
jgi:hypothetical protein